MLKQPGLTVTVAQMLAALELVAGKEVAARVQYRYDEKIDRLVSGWPGALDAGRAVSLGFAVDTDFAGIIRAHIAESAN